MLINDDNLGALVLARREVELEEVMARFLGRLFEKDFSYFQGIRRMVKRHVLRENDAFNARTAHSFINKDYLGR